MRIQYDLSEEELNRSLPFILNEKHRHVFAHKAFIEWIVRQEGNNKRRVKK